jgi:hypothetical protein
MEPAFAFLSESGVQIALEAFESGCLVQQQHDFEREFKEGYSLDNSLVCKEDQSRMSSRCK